MAGLVHLNGRVYDPLLARFTSADPTVTDPMNAQGWNRYSYVGNDPLAFTDPNGYSWSSFWSGVWHGVTNFFANNSIARAILQIGLNIALNILVPGAIVLAAAVSASIVTGLSGGNLGQVLRAGLVAGATTAAFAGLNFIAPAQAFGAGFNAVAYAENVAGSALIGCASSAASGGSCGSGAAAAAVSAGLAPITNYAFPNAANDFGQRIGGSIVQATAGGLASVAGGGKFANGAVTGAFAYMASLSVARDRMMNAYACGPACPVFAGTIAIDVAFGTSATATVLGWLGIGTAAVVGGAIIYNNATESPDLTDDKGKDHILDGDNTGGGHRAGTGISGKSEFPPNWSDEKILGEISDVATDPASVRTTQGARTISKGTRDGVDIRTVDDGRRIITGYPTNTPRNP